MGNITMTYAAPVVAASLSGIPTISGTTQVGQTLTANSATVSGTEPITTEWQWFADGIAIGGATSNTYIAQSGDVNKSVTVRQTVTNSGGSDNATSNGVVITTDQTAPAFTTPPSASAADPSGGFVLLTATPGTVSGNPTPTSTGQWFVNGSQEVVGETGLTYNAPEASPGVYFYRQTATNAVGSAVSDSNGVAVGQATIESIELKHDWEFPSGTSGSFVVNIPPEMVGTYELLIFSGGRRQARNVTIDGVPVDEVIFDDDGGGAGGRMSLVRKFAYTANGSGSFTVAYTLAGSVPDIPFQVHAVKGGELVTPTNAAKAELGVEESATVYNPCKTAESYHMGFSVGNREFFAPSGSSEFPEWEGLSTSNKIYATNRTFASDFSKAENVPGGYYFRDFNVAPGTADGVRAACAYLVYTPIGAAIAPESLVDSQWTLVDEGSEDGDVVLVQPLAQPYKDAHRIAYFDLELQKTSGTVVERIYMGSDTRHARRHRADVNAVTPCRIRAGFQPNAGGPVVDGAWSPVKNVQTTTVAARVLVTSNRSTAYVGEAVHIIANPVGFNTARTATGRLRSPIHFCDFHITVDGEGETGNCNMYSLYEEVLGPLKRNETNAPIFAFAAKEPGVRTFTVTVRDRHGNTAVATHQVTFVDPLTTFAEADIYAVDTSGIWPGVPAGANKFTTFSAMATALNAAAGINNNALVLLHDNQVYADTATRNWDWQDFMVRRYGNGTFLPRLNAFWTIKASQIAASDGIDWKGPFDASLLGMARPGDGPDFQFSVNSSFANSYTTGFNVCLYYSRRNNNCAIFNSSIGFDQYGNIFAWANFGLFGGDVGNVAIHGLSTLHHPESLRSTAGKGETASVIADHGPARSSRPDGYMIRFGIFAFTNGSWGNVDGFQDPDRMFGSGQTNGGPWITYQRFVTLGGSMNVSRSSRGGGQAGCTPQDCVISDGMHLTTGNPRYCITIGQGGTTVRNVCFTALDQIVETIGSGFSNFVQLRPDYLTAFELKNNSDNPVTFENCTFICDVADANSSATGLSILDFNAPSGQPDFTDVTNVNFVSYAPRLTATPIDPNGALDTTQLTTNNLRQARYDRTGTSPNFVITVRPEYILDISGIATYAVTASTTDGYQNATGSVPYRDALGNVRPAGLQSKGWLEPA